MHGDHVGGPIRWRMHVPVPPDTVYRALDPDSGRASFELCGSEDGGPDLSPMMVMSAFGVDLRNHDPIRSWDQGYAD
jgi:hypothetical protein